MKKIKLKEDELVGLIEKLVKENLGSGNGTNFGMMGTPTAKYKEMFETEDIEEDSEGEETYNYGEDEGEDKKEEKGLERDEEMAPKDRIGEIEKHLDALKKDMGYDEDREDRDEKDTEFSEGKKGSYMGAPSKTEKRDTYDGKPGEVVGVDSNIKKQRNEGKKAKTLNLTENQLVGIVERMVREQEEEKEKKNVIGKTWEQLSDFARKLFTKNPKFKMCRPKKNKPFGKCPVWSSMSDTDKTKIIQTA